MKPKIDIMICTKDRPTEIALLLQSLRSQTYQNFDVYIYDDRSGVPTRVHHYINCIVNRLIQEGHRVIIWREDNIRYGVTKLRNIMVNKIMDEGRGELILRLDDDVILEQDYIQELLKVINEGYDIASGVMPDMISPSLIRDTKYVEPFIADIGIKDGEISYFFDDCGIKYLNNKIIPSSHFRGLALIKKEVHKKVNYEVNLGFSSYREEEFFSFRAIIEGFKIGVNTGALAWHLRTPSGGERTQEYVDGFKRNDELLNNFVKKLYKEHGDFLTKYKKQFAEPREYTELELKKETNVWKK